MNVESSSAFSCVVFLLSVTYVSGFICKIAMGRSRKLIDTVKLTLLLMFFLIPFGLCFMHLTPFWNQRKWPKLLCEFTYKPQHSYIGHK